MLPNTQKTNGSTGAVVPASSTPVEETMIRQEKLIQQLLNRMDQYEDTMKLLTETMAENVKLKARIEELEKSHGSNSQIENQPEFATKLVTPVYHHAINSTPRSYATAAATPTTKQAPRRKHSKPIPFDRASRLFTGPSPTNGFKFVYLPQKGRVPMGEIRKSLSALKINNSRIIDIHFPARNTCALLIHVDFEATLISALMAAGIKPLNNFYPEDPNTLNDPALQLLSLEEKTNIVIELHQTRCMRITSRAPNRVQAALAYHFISNGTFSRDDLNNYKYPHNNHTTFAPEQDTNMIEPTNSEAKLHQ